LRITDIEFDTTVQQLNRKFDHELRSSLASLRGALAVADNRPERGEDIRGAGRVSFFLGRGVDVRPGRKGYR
jgi:hypothetical protein